MYKLIGKFAFLFLMMTGIFGIANGSFDQSNSRCPLKSDFDCCVYYCTHDPGSGCNGSGSCCANLCR